MSTETESRSLIVSLLALPEMTPAALYGLLEVFSSVGITWSQLTGEPAPARRMDARIVALRRHEDAIIARCQRWIAEHYAGPNPVARMVERSGLPARTFKRRFRAATGYTPVDYVQTLRIEEAKQLLETTDEPTDAVAHRVGYEDPAFFRRLFKRRTGVTPARYRQRFQAVARLRP